MYSFLRLFFFLKPCKHIFSLRFSEMGCNIKAKVWAKFRTVQSSHMKGFFYASFFYRDFFSSSCFLSLKRVMNNVTRFCAHIRSVWINIWWKFHTGSRMKAQGFRIVSQTIDLLCVVMKGWKLGALIQSVDDFLNQLTCFISLQKCWWV